MEVQLDLVHEFQLRATTPDNITFTIDAHSPTPAGPPPMMLLLASVPACSTMDILSILRKQRVQIEAFHVDTSATRATEHPHVFTSIHLHYVLTSPDATEEQLRRAIELSLTKYCSAAAMVRQAGCHITWTCHVQRPTA